MGYEFSLDIGRDDKGWNEDVFVMQCGECNEKFLVPKNNSQKDCLYCGSNNTNEGDEELKYKPKEIIPFKINEEEAVKRAERFLHKCSYNTPKRFKKKFKAGNVQKFYRPFWYYQVKVVIDYRGSQVEKNPKGENARRSRGEKISDKIGYTMFKLKSSIKKYDVEAEKIQDIVYSTAIEYDLDYLKDYKIQPIDNQPEQWNVEVLQNIKKAAADKLRKGLEDKHSKVILKKTDYSYKDGLCKLILIPIWRIDYVYKGETYTFLVNGQTGETDMDYPISMKRFIGIPLIIFLIIITIVKVALV